MGEVRARQVFTPPVGAGQQAAVLATPRLDRFAERVVFTAKRRVNVRSGLLRDSIGRTTARAEGTRVRVEVHARAEHAIYIHEGTRAHEIRPRHARALRFWWRGRLVFRKRVWHPGYKGNPFLRDAITEELSQGL
ncbi:HK97 gp10 family phage protein [Nocardia farcinica]|uniref:HK97 gp10 family phage protein n=1 Tax=Nocardia farcinica TaxID=37329 RepID=UPI0024544313|nr:HK97 gp10 family phage protein [Nocardia farcinica]